MVERILDVLNELSQRIGIPVLTPEYEIALALLDVEGMGADALLEESSLSRSGFFHTVERLKYWGILTCVSSPADRRRKIYRLREASADAILQDFGRYCQSYQDREAMHVGTNDLIALVKSIHGDDIKLTHLTCEYQILLHLFLSPRSPNNMVVDAVSYSATKANTALQMLVSANVVVMGRDEKDRRMKRYSMTTATHRALELVHVQGLDWLRSKSGKPVSIPLSRRFTSAQPQAH